MQVVSGPIGRERVHFEAPAARRMEREMRAFLKWCNDQSNMDPVVKAGLAHLWFVTIHPFDDGNGRIARAIADMMLARSEDSNKRFYSMSSQIREQRRSYYEILERTQKGSLDVTAWLKWFLECLGDAIDAAQTTLRTVIAAARFWQSAAGLDLNERQRLMLNRLMNGFEGKLTTSKYAKLMKCSTDTALRDVEKLLEKGILTKDAAGGRSTSYTLAEFT
jgi:Fic family protein